VAFTQDQLDALDAQIAAAGPVEATAFQDQNTKFRSIDDLLKLRAQMQREINAGSGSVRYAVVSRGFNEAPASE
jgi:hypothetical protein